MVFFITLALLFIIRLRFHGKPFLNVIYKRYGEDGIKDFRRFEHLDFSLRKLICDLDFLLICFNNHLIPNFLKFKTSISRITSDQDYRNYQRTLLQKEIDFKRQRISEDMASKSKAFQTLKNRSSFLDFNHFINNLQ